MNTDHRQEQITLPGLSFKDREIAYIKVLSPMITSERQAGSDDKRKPATVIKVENLQDHLNYRLICPALLVSSFMDEGEEYVGKCYEIIVTSQVLPGKSYKGVQVFAIDCNRDYGSYPTKVEDDSETYEAERA